MRKVFRKILEEKKQLICLLFVTTEGSQDYNLDQANTNSAINELQGFYQQLSKFRKSKNINEMIDELNYKLEFKAYENASNIIKWQITKLLILLLKTLLNDFLQQN